MSHKTLVSETRIARSQGSPYEPPIAGEVVTHFSTQLMACETTDDYATLIFTLSALIGRLQAMQQWADFDLALVLKGRAS